MAPAGTLMKYGPPIFKRDRYRCRYCELDGSKWPNWLFLTLDHLLPKGHPKRDDRKYIVTACAFCNTADNYYFIKAKRDRFSFNKKSPAELVKRRKAAVQVVREKYNTFWKENVRGKTTATRQRSS